MILMLLRNTFLQTKDLKKSIYFLVAEETRVAAYPPVIKFK